MRVLLIIPNSSFVNRSWAYRKFCTPVLPLGIAYIAAVLEENGIGVSVIDQFATKTSDKNLLKSIKEYSPDVVGFSALTPVIYDIRRLSECVRQTSGKTKIVLGNTHATCFPEQVLREGIADIVVRGEGEATMLELCQRLSKNRELIGLRGLSLRLDGEIIHNPDREPVDNLDALPLPAWHLFHLDNYAEIPLVGINKAAALPITASRGCPYRCYYCSQDKIYEKPRYRDLHRVVDEIELFNRKFNVHFFGFCDAYFPFDENSGLEFCDLLLQRGLNKKIKWCTEARVDKVTPRLLKIMKRAGAHLIMYGIEVGNAGVLKSLNKGTTLEQARTAIRETRRAGIFSNGLFILGLPTETKETCCDTIKFAKELNCDIVKFNLAMPYPGSRFFEDYHKEKTLDKPEKFTSWFDWADPFGDDLVYTPEGMDGKTLRYLQRRAMLEFYLRPGVIFKYIYKRIVSYKDVFYGGLWLLLLFCFGALKRLKYLTKGASRQNGIQRPD